VTHRLGDELLVYVPRTDTAHALNRSAAAIWQLCDGTRTIADISREIGRSIGRPDEELLGDVTMAVSELRRLGLPAVK
jgi:hypothetical protein